MNTVESLTRRRSVRRFSATSLPKSLVHDILDLARWAPSGGNTQPWKVIAVSGAAQQAVIDLARRHLVSGAPSEEGEDPIYPPNLWDPYRSRRYKIGEDMYALLGIPREDKARRLAHVASNFGFFGAPVGLFFVIDARLGRGQWAHLGMFMQSIALAALAQGVSSCMQESWAMVRRSLAAHFELPAHEMIYCGMALGYEDPDAPVNRLRPDRAAVEEFATFKGFDD